MNPQSNVSPASRFPLQRVAAAAALACGLLLTACGGGGDDSTTTTTSSLSQSDATADAANSAPTGSDTASAMDSVIDTTTALSLAVEQSASASSDRAQAQSTSPSAVGYVTNVTVNCAGGGTAVLSITGGTALTELNGQLDAGEHYSVAYTQCTGGAGYAQLNGTVEMDVVSADHTTWPSAVSVNLTVTNLALTLPSGSATLNSTATVSRSVVTANGTTTTTSNVTVPSATLATGFNSRTGSFSLTNLDATRVLTSIAGVTTGSTYSGTHTLSGTANGRTFSMTVATNGNVSYDATGTLVAGDWTVVRPTAAIGATVANGSVTLTVDDGNNGTIDHTWTFPTAQLNAAAG